MHQSLDIRDIRLGNDEAYSGPLGELNIAKQHKVLVVAVRKLNGDFLTATDAGTALSPGDIAVVVGRPHDIDRFEKLASSSGKTITIAATAAVAFTALAITAVTNTAALLPFDHAAQAWITEKILNPNAE